MEKITVETWNVLVPENFDEYIEQKIENQSGEYIVVGVKSYISFEDKIAFVKRAADLCFVDGEYHSALLDYAISVCELLYFTNIECNIDAEVMNRLLSCTNIISVVHNVVDESILNILSTAVCEEIDSRTDNVNNAAKLIVTFINALVEADEGSEQISLADWMRSLSDNESSDVG